MAQNYIQPGDVLTYVNTGTAILSGGTVKMGTVIGIALVDIAATTGSGAVAVEGVFKVTKLTGTAWAIGDPIYWDATANNFTKVSSSNTLAGYAFEAALSADATGLIKLTHT